MKRATIKSAMVLENAAVTARQLKQRSTRRKQVLLAATAAAMAGATLATQRPARAATLTWAGTIADPSSPTYTSNFPYFTSGQNLYKWDTTTANWTGAATTYSNANDVVFDGNVSSGNLIELPTAGMNPATMTFNNGTTSTLYTFLRNTDFSTSTGGSVNGASPYTGVTASSTTQLVLAPGFLGTVSLRARPGANGGTASLTMINSGILELHDGGALPGNTNSAPIVINGGELRWNVDTAGNTTPAATQIVGAMTVNGMTGILSNGVVASQTSSRVWNGPITITNNSVLSLKSINGSRVDLNAANLTGTTNVGTLRLLDSDTAITTVALQNANNSGPTAIFDTGVGSSELLNGSAAATATYTFGGLIGGPNTFLSGSNGTTNASVTTYQIGTRGDTNDTYAGKIRDGSGTSAQTAITKIGSGTQTLSGQLIYTGDTNVNAGTLALAGDAQMPNINANNGGTASITGANGAVTGNPSIVLNANQGGTIKLDNSVNNNNDRIGGSTAIHLRGGTFSFVGQVGTNEATGDLALEVLTGNVTAGGTGGTVTFNSLNRTSKTTINFDLAAGVNLNFNTAPTLTGGIIGGFATVNGTQDWATLSGSTVAAFSGYTPAANDGDLAAAGATANVNITSASALNVPASQTLNSLKLSGGGGVSIASGQTLTLTTGGVLVPGATSPNIDGAGNITAGTTAGSELFLLLPSASTTLTVNAKITDNPGGSVAVVKSGAGTLRLNNTANSFTGGLSVLAGALQLGGPNSISGDLTIDNNTTVDIGGFNQTIGALHLLNGTLGNTGAAATVTGTAFDVRSGTIVPSIAGSGAVLTKTTGGTVNLSATNTYTGGSVVNAGTLNANAVNALGPGNLTVNGGTLAIANNNQTVGVVQITGGTISGGTTGVLTGSSYDVQAGTISGIIAGTSSNLAKNGAAATVATLSNTGNTYGGTTTINSGTLTIQNIADGGAASAMGNSSSAASNLVFNGGGLTITNAGTTNRLFTVNGDFVLSANTNPGVTFSSTGTIPNPGGSTLTLGGNGNASVMNPKLTGGGSLIKLNGGTWTLNNSGNDYAGTTTISGGTLNAPFVADGEALSSIGTGSGFNILLKGGTFAYTGITPASTNRLFSLETGATGGTISNNAAAAANTLTFSSTSDMGGGGVGFTLTLAGTNTGNNTMAVHLTNGSTALLKNGAGTWILTNNNNDYTGITTITLGILQISNIANGGVASQIGAATSAAGNLVLNGGTLKYTGPTASTDHLFTLSAASSIDASGTGPLTFANTGTMGAGTVVLTLTGTNTGNNTMALLIGGGATGITKAGAGTWLLTNSANSYTGVTTVSAGTLSVASISNSGANSALGAAATANTNLVLSGGTLQYTGSGHSTNRLFTIGAGSSAIDSSGAGPLSFTGTGALGTTTSAATLTLTGSNTGSNTIAGQIGGTATGLTKSGAGSWILTSATGNVYGGPTSVSAGSLVVQSLLNTSAVTVSGGTMQMAAGGGSNRVIKTGALSVTGSGKLDINDNKIITTSAVGSATAGTYNGVTGLIQSGRNGGGWTGNGIVTSQTAATTSSFTSIGIAAASDVKGIAATATAVWGGQTVTGSQTLVMYTYGGDANLDGKINVDDYGHIDSSIPLGIAGWLNGDFNYDGKINVDDYGVIDFNIGIQGAAFPTGAGIASGGDSGGLSGVAAVPEPASLSLVGLAAVGMLGRRRRRRELVV